MTDTANEFEAADGLATLLKAAMSASGSNALEALLKGASVPPVQAELLSLLVKAGSAMDVHAEDGLDPVYDLDADDWRDIDEAELLDVIEDRELEPQAVDNQEATALRTVNDTLAAALGACRLCWGGDTDCPECEGRGTTGSRCPDTALFCDLVMPAVKRFHRSTKVTRNSNKGDAR